MKRTFLVLCIVTVGLILLSLYQYGLRDGLKFDATAIATGLMNRSQSDDIPSELPLYELKISKENLAVLNSDLPTSGKTRVPGKFFYEGIMYPVEVKYRGNLALHWKGPKKSMRLFFLKKSPFGKLKKVNFVNPKTYHVINNHISMWLGKQIGMNTIHDKLAFLRLNGKNYGVMEIMEQPDGRYEMNRNIRRGQIPVYKGDYIPEGDTVMKSELLWESALNWAYKSNADSAESNQVLRKLVSVVNAEIPNSEKVALIDNYIDMEEYIKYYAGLRLINTVHIDQTHNQIIVYNQDEGKFYPVLWDPTVMWPAQNDNNFYMIYDALCYIILADPLMREKRDMLIYEYTTIFHDEKVIYNKMDEKIQLIEDDVYLDHNKCNPVTGNLNDVNKFSDFHFSHSYKKLKEHCAIHFNEMKQAIEYNEISQSRLDKSLTLNYKTNSPIILNIELDKPGEIWVSDNSVQYEVISENNSSIKVKLYGNVDHIDGRDNNPYAVSRSYIPANGTFIIESKSLIKKVELINSISGDTLR